MKRGKGTQVGFSWILPAGKKVSAYTERVIPSRSTIAGQMVLHRQLETLC